MRKISPRRDNAGRKTTPAERDRELGATELDKIAAAGGPKGGGVGSGGGAGGDSN